MADLSNNSFIPKRGPVKRSRGSASRQVYVFTLISYVLMFATLLATGSVYLYSKYVDKQLENEVAALNTEINSFSEADMQQVIEFDRRLGQAYERLNNSVSIVSVFDALEAATIDTVQVKALNIVREKDEKLVIKASVETDSFDSTIFQRGVFKRNQTIDSVTILNVQDTANNESGEGTESSKSLVTFTAQLEVPLSSVLYEGNVNQPKSMTISTPKIESVDSVADTMDEPSVEAANEENI